MTQTHVHVQQRLETGRMRIFAFWLVQKKSKTQDYLIWYHLGS